MKEKVMLVIPILIGALLLLPLTSAAAAGWFNMTLTDFTNATTGTNNISITVAAAADYNVTNVTCYYNSSGGAQYPNQNATFLGTTINNTALDSSFAITGTIATEYTNVNVTCVLANDSDSAGVLPLGGGNSTISARQIKIDGTAPATGLTINPDEVPTRGVVKFSWAPADSSSGIMWVNVTLTSPNNGDCPPQNYSAKTGTYSLSSDYTACTGTYNLSMKAVDYSGNAFLTYKTFKVEDSGARGGSSGVASSQSGGPGAGIFGIFSVFGNKEGRGIGALGEQTGRNIAILIILGAALYLFFRKK